MINLELDLGYLKSHYHISTNALKRYENKSLIEIMQIEAAKGNQKAAEFILKIKSDPTELVKVLQLMNPQNRYLILREMNEADLMEVMQYLKPEELVLGLNVFTKDAIVELMMKLEPESLATVVLEKMDPTQFLAMLPEKFLDEFIDSDKIDKSMFIEALESIDDAELRKMMTNFTGTECQDDKDTIIKNLSVMPDDKFTGAMHMFEQKGKQQLILGLLENKPELFEEFSPEAMVHPFKMMEKSDILNSLLVLNTEDMLPMLEGMNQDIMALIATQIDPETFAKLLSSNFSDVIAKCAA